MKDSQMEYTLERLKKMMDANGGSLDLSGTPIKSLPDGLTVGGALYLRETLITSLPDGLTVGGSLVLSGTPIKSLPDGLTVGGSLDLCGTQITALPDGLTVGGSLDLSGTPIKSLPDGLTVGGWLDLRGTPIKSLPDGLTVGGWLDFGGTPIKSLPEGLTVGGIIFSNGKITNPTAYHKLRNGDYVVGKYLFCDGILTHVKRKKQIGNYTYYIGRIKGKNVIYDGENYAHCKSLKYGINDLEFKRAKERGAEQYKGYKLDTVVTYEDAITMYRIITGACKAGTEQFISSLREVKDKYTVREIIDITKGQYRAEVFRAFFDKE